MNVLEELDWSFNTHKEKIAIKDSSKTLTYGQLDILTAKVAEHLMWQKIANEDVVTIEAEDKLEAIILMLGVVRAGLHIASFHKTIRIIAKIKCVLK